MSEEAEKVIKAFIEDYNASYPEEKEWVAIYPNQIEAIETILSAYEQGLKEIQEIVLKSEDDEDIIVDCRTVGRIQILLNLIEKQQKEIEKYKSAFIKKRKYCELLEKDLFENCSNYVVSKDKIREKIKELEEDVKDFEEYWSKDPRKFKKEKCIDYYKLEVLKELLEEE